jgi:hypothetical protein
VNDQTLEELLESWKEERISAKEVIDQLLRHLRLLLDQLRALERSMPASPPPVPSLPAAPRSARPTAKRR